MLTYHQVEAQYQFLISVAVFQQVSKKLIVILQLSIGPLMN
jgi:hypothetical protein